MVFIRELTLATDVIPNRARIRRTDAIQVDARRQNVESGLWRVVVLYERLLLRFRNKQDLGLPPASEHRIFKRRIQPVTRSQTVPEGTLFSDVRRVATVGSVVESNPGIRLNPTTAS